MVLRLKFQEDEETYIPEVHSRYDELVKSLTASDFVIPRLLLEQLENSELSNTQAGEKVSK